MNCKECIWKSPETCKACRKENKMVEIERKLLYLLQSKSELDREIRVGKEAEQELIKVNEKIKGCCILLANENSPLD